MPPPRAMQRMQDAQRYSEGVTLADATPPPQKTTAVRPPATPTTPTPALSHLSSLVAALGHMPSALTSVRSSSSPLQMLEAALVHSTLTSSSSSPPSVTPSPSISEGVTSPSSSPPSPSRGQAQHTQNRQNKRDQQYLLQVALKKKTHTPTTPKAQTTRKEKVFSTTCNIVTTPHLSTLCHLLSKGSSALRCMVRGMETEPSEPRKHSTPKTYTECLLRQRKMKADSEALRKADPLADYIEHFHRGEPSHPASSPKVQKRSPKKQRGGGFFDGLYEDQQRSAQTAPTPAPTPTPDVQRQAPPAKTTMEVRGGYRDYLRQTRLEREAANATEERSQEVHLSALGLLTNILAQEQRAGAGGGGGGGGARGSEAPSPVTPASPGVGKVRRTRPPCSTSTGCKRAHCVVLQRNAGKWVREDFVLAARLLPLRRCCTDKLNARQRAALEGGTTVKDPTAAVAPSIGGVQQGAYAAEQRRRVRANAESAQSSPSAPVKQRVVKGRKEVPIKPIALSRPYSPNAPRTQATEPEGLDAVRGEIHRLQAIVRSRERALAKEHVDLFESQGDFAGWREEAVGY